MPRRTPSSNGEPNPATTRRVVALGGGHGLAAVLTALRGEGHELTVVVTTADDGGSSGALRRMRGGPAVGDLRRSLIALSGEDAALGRAFARQLEVAGLGRHPLGNLVLRSVADGLGDLADASRWLGERLGIDAVVLPATAEPVCLLAHDGERPLYGESAIGTTVARIERLDFDPPRPRVYEQVLAAIGQADFVLLAPGSLFTSVLATCAVPDIAGALSRTSASVVWISNSECDGRGETIGMSAQEHLAAICVHGLSLDAMLYDPCAELAFDAHELETAGVAPFARPLIGPVPGLHDPELLRTALRDLFAALSDQL